MQYADKAVQNLPLRNLDEPGLEQQVTQYPKKPPQKTTEP